MIDIQANTNKLLQFVGNKFENGELNNESLVQLIEQCFSYLNAETLPNYAKINNLSYNGVKKCRNIVTIRNVKFVIEND